MGEITEMMEEGMLCQVCGVYLNIDGEYGPHDDFHGTGTWTTCKSCRADEEPRKPKKRKKGRK